MTELATKRKRKGRIGGSETFDEFLAADGLLAETESAALKAIRAASKRKRPKTGSVDERVATWPEAQGDLLRFIIDTEAKYFGAYRLSEAERTAVQEGLAQARRGEFASGEEVEALFNRFGRPKKSLRRNR